MSPLCSMLESVEGDGAGSWQGTYHSRRTVSLSLVHVVDFAMAASMLGRPLVARSETASAEQRVEKSEMVANRAYNALSESWPAIFVKTVTCQLVSLHDGLCYKSLIPLQLATCSKLVSSVTRRSEHAAALGHGSNDGGG